MLSVTYSGSEHLGVCSKSHIECGALLPVTFCTCSTGARRMDPPLLCSWCSNSPSMQSGWKHEWIQHSLPLVAAAALVASTLRKQHHEHKELFAQASLMTKLVHTSKTEKPRVSPEVTEWWSIPVQLKCSQILPLELCSPANDLCGSCWGIPHRTWHVSQWVPF